MTAAEETTSAHNDTTTANPPGTVHDVEKPNGHLNGDASPEPEPKRTVTGLKWFIVFTSLMSNVILFALDNTIVATVQPAIVEAFGDQQELAWIGVSFVLGQVVILPIGKAYGMFSMKILFVVSLILFEVGSAICGAAPNMTATIVGRVIAGFGGSGVYVGGLTYISVLTTPHERPIYLAILMSVWGFGNVLGPIVGGSFAVSNATWRWGFYINLPIAALFAPAFLFSLPNINAMPDKPMSEKLRMQDWVGIVIFTAFCACFYMAGSFGGTLYEWNSGSEITLWVMTFVLLIVFIFVTVYHHPLVPAKLRVMPVQFMRTKDLVILPLQAFLVAGSMMMSIYYTPLIFQFTRGDGPLMAGVRILPLICMIVFGCLFNGFAMPKFGYYMPWFVVGNALLLAGAALMTTIEPSISNSALYGYTVLIGLGVGAFQSAGIGVASALAPPSEISNVVSVMTVGSIFQNQSIRYIAAAMPNVPEDELAQLITGASGAFYQNLNDSDQALVVEQIMNAIRESFYYLVGSTALGFIAERCIGILAPIPTTSNMVSVDAKVSGQFMNRSKNLTPMTVVPGPTRKDDRRQMALILAQPRDSCNWPEAGMALRSCARKTSIMNENPKTWSHTTKLQMPSPGVSAFSMASGGTARLSGCSSSAYLGANMGENSAAEIDTADTPTCMAKSSVMAPAPSHRTTREGHDDHAADEAEVGGRENEGGGGGRGHERELLQRLEPDGR
ncbi:hypothetical protein DL771_003407 [Monosporascus sp. 5C6A]|nr:hypothetical protein DL771_003407 [Monosporascus sp. 5C6A]